MSQLSDIIGTGHDLLVEMDPATIVWKTKTFSGLADPLVMKRGKRQAGGQFLDPECSCTIKRSAFGGGDLPASGETITVDGVVFFVGPVTADSSTVTIQLLPK
jgi:hypothetical protein